MLLFFCTGGTGAAYRCIETWIEGIKIFRIKLILDGPECFAEALKMNNLSCTEEADGLDNIRLLDKPENVVISAAGFLLCCKVFMKICDRVSLRLKFTGVKRNTAGCLWPDSDCVIHIIRSKTGFLDFFRRESPCQLMNNGSHHFQMSQLLGADIVIVIAHVNF